MRACETQVMRSYGHVRSWLEFSLSLTLPNGAVAAERLVASLMQDRLAAVEDDVRSKVERCTLRA
jgi:hypothetical protein